MSLILSHNAWLDTQVINGENTTLIDQLFNRFDGMYSNRFRSAFVDKSAINNWRNAWSEALSEEGVTPQQVGDAIKACRMKYDWPPTLPEFLKLCKPETSFDYYAAFIEAVEQIHKRTTGDDKWSHPAIYWAAVVIGTFDLRNATWSAIEKRWTTTLKNELAKGQWPDVPENVPALPAPGKTALTNEQVKAHMAMLRAAVPGMFR